MSRSTTQLPDDWTDLQVAQYRTVHEYRRNSHSGAKALAPIIGKSPATISNEVNPAMESHKLGLADSVVLQNATRDFRILEAYAADLGFLVIPVPDFPPVTDIELLNQYAEWQAALGRTHEAIRRCLQDRRVDSAELAEIKRSAREHMTAFQGFLQRLESLAEPPL